ncbi:MAG: SDR family oxidoreductase [Polyangiaceae bacterium]|nr:SDR family oxidoreductase [Polyangiaceae bacterium]
MSAWDIAGKSVLITGGNAGIGRETARALARRGARVYLTSRVFAEGERVARAIEAECGGKVGVFVLDLASFASIRSMAAEFLERCPSLHVLINNAGAVLTERRETREGFEMTLGVNHLGHFLLTQLLLERLRASAPARIINVASDAHHRAPGGLDFEDIQSRHRYNGWFAYCRSKLANIYFTRSLARKLEGTGVTVNALHPGFVSTKFGADGDTRGLIRLGIRLAQPFAISVEKGAQTTIYCASEPRLRDISGAYFAKCREVAPSRAARDPLAADRLWSLSEHWIAAGRAQ